MSDNKDKEEQEEKKILTDEEWEKRLSPVANKQELTEEDKKLIEEQEKTGKEIDELYEYEKFLNRHKQYIPINDYRNILYYLPCDDATRKKIYNELLNEKKK